MTLGERMKERRLLLGMTLDDVAKIVKVSRQTIHKYETGIISNVPSDRIETIARALKTTPAYIMGWEEPRDFSRYVEAMEDNPLLVELLDNAKEVSDERLKLIISMVKEMK